MGAHVCGDAARLGELSVADAAVERLLPAVGAAVRRQVGRLAERLVALDAAVRPLPAVGPQMGLPTKQFSSARSFLYLQG